ncbi:hypothetical protein ACT453_53135, partial [Bacillus sp. D-CC]
FSREAPRSRSPRKATVKQSWRTGQHGADNAKISAVKSKEGVKYVNVGWLKGDNSPFFYMKFQDCFTVALRGLRLLGASREKPS